MLNSSLEDAGDQEGRSPSRRGYYALGIVAVAAVAWTVYTKFIMSTNPLRVERKQASVSNGVPRPVSMPEPDNVQQPQAESKKTEPKQMSRGQRSEKSELQKMREKMKLISLYSPPLIPGLGTNGRLRVQKQGGLEDGDMPREPRGRQVLDIPPAYRNGQGNGQGNVWTRDFYERGDRQTGVLRRPQSPFVVQRGWKIPARLDDPINTDTPGQITATVLQDIKDSASGRHTLIPAGSQLVGGYDTRIGYGQERLPSAWDWLNLPCNSGSMSLAAMPGADRQGYAGLPIDVDNHLWSTAARSALLTITGAGGDFIARGATSGSGYGFDSALRREGGRELDRESRRVFGRGNNRPPTGTAKSGDVFFVQVTEPLVFDGPFNEEIACGMGE